MSENIESISVCGDIKNIFWESQCSKKKFKFQKFAVSTMKECCFGNGALCDLHCQITLRNMNLRHNKLLVNWRVMIPAKCAKKKKKS